MPRSNSSVGSNGGGGGGMSNVTSVPGGTVPSSPTSVPGISATSAAAVAAAAAAANNSIADKTNYTLNALEQIRNSLQPYISNNSSERPMSSASGSGVINQSLFHPSLMYLYNANNFSNNGNVVQYGQQNCINTANNKTFIATNSPNCDNANNTLNTNNEHVINIQKQFIKQLLENGCSEELTTIIDNILKESPSAYQPGLLSDSNMVNMNQSASNSQMYKNSQTNHPIVIDRLQQQQYVQQHKLSRKPSAPLINSNHLDSPESTGIYSAAASDKSALSSTSSVCSDSPVVNGIVNMQRDRLLPDQPKIVSSSGIPIKEDQRYNQLNFQQQATMLDSSGIASGYSSCSSSSMSQSQSLHAPNHLPQYNVFSHSSSSVTSSSSSSSSQYHRLQAQQQSFTNVNHQNHLYHNSSQISSPNKRLVTSKMPNKAQNHNSNLGVYHRVISPTRSLPSSGPNVSSSITSSISGSTSTSTFRPTDPLPPPPLPPHRSNMAPPPPPPPHPLPMIVNEQTSRSSSLSNISNPQTDDMNPLQHYMKRQISNNLPKENSIAVSSSVSSVSANSYVSCRPNAFSYASSASSSSPQRGTSPISFSSRFGSSGLNPSSNTPSPCPANGFVSQVTQKLQNLNLNSQQSINNGSSSMSSPYSGQSSIGFVSIANSPPPSYAASSSSGRQSPTPTISSSSDYASIPVVPQRNNVPNSQPTQSPYQQVPFSTSQSSSIQNLHRKISPVSSASSISVQSSSMMNKITPSSINSGSSYIAKHSLQAWSARQAISQSPIIMQSVKSQQVQKPVLQTAVAPTLPPINVKTPTSLAPVSSIRLSAPTGVATQPTLPFHSTSTMNGNGQNQCSMYSSNASSCSSTSSVKSASTSTKNPPPYPSAQNKLSASAVSPASSSTSSVQNSDYHAAPPPPYSSAIQQQSNGRSNSSSSQTSLQNYHKIVYSVKSSDLSIQSTHSYTKAPTTPPPPPPPPPPPYSVSLTLNQQDSIAQIISGLGTPPNNRLNPAPISLQASSQSQVQVPTTDPPSYASSMAALAAQRAVVVSSSGVINSSDSHMPVSCFTSTVTNTTYSQSSIPNMANLGSSNSSCSSIYSQPPMSGSSQTGDKSSLNIHQSNCDLVNTVESICTSQVSALQCGVTRRPPLADSTGPPLPPKPSSSGNNIAPPPPPHLPPHLQHHHQLISDVASVTSSGGSINNDYDLESLSASSTASTRPQLYINNPMSSKSQNTTQTCEECTTPNSELCDLSKAFNYEDVDGDGSQDLVIESEDGTKKRTHQSPIPTRRNISKAKEKERGEFKVRNYSPAAFKFFMEQHVENLIKSQMQRERRREQLEHEMAKVGLTEEAQLEMRRMLCQKESNYIRLRRAKMNRSMFKKIKTIGVGAFGEVALVRKTDANLLYAMKVLVKADVLKRNQVAHVKAERDILAEADNEWVVKLYYSFQDEEHLYFVMDYIPGGDLMSLLIKFGVFTEKLAMFYIAELVLAVESVHKMGFIHRDIKPDNILIDKDGHIKLTDFGLCTGFRWTHNSKYYHERGDSMDFDGLWSDEDWSMSSCNCSSNPPLSSKPLERRKRREHQRCLAHSLVGTPNYIAPEVLMRTGYTQLCDWWSVGVILYEMVVGQPPFFANSPEETQRKVINWEKTLRIPKEARVSLEVTDLILKLCCGSENRIGKNGVDEIKRHSFFKSIDFEGGLRNQVAPYIPKIKYATDTSNFDPVDPERLHSDNSDNECDIEAFEYGNASSMMMNRPHKNKEKVLEQNSKHPEHAFFEFTFRRFFDASGQAYPIKLNDPLTGNLTVTSNTMTTTSSALTSDMGLYACTTDSTMSETTSQTSGTDYYEEVPTPPIVPATTSSSLPMMSAIVPSCSQLTVSAVAAATAVSNTSSKVGTTSLSNGTHDTNGNTDQSTDAANNNPVFV